MSLEQSSLKEDKRAVKARIRDAAKHASEAQKHAKIAAELAQEAKSNWMRVAGIKKLSDPSKVINFANTKLSQTNDELNESRHHMSEAQRHGQLAEIHARDAKEGYPHYARIKGKLHIRYGGAYETFPDAKKARYDLFSFIDSKKREKVVIVKTSIGYLLYEPSDSDTPWQ